MSFLVVPLSGITQLEKKVIFQPDSCQGKDAVIGECAPCGNDYLNFGAADEFGAIAWTYLGFPSIHRGLIQFDLTTIPVSATIVSAKLSLYWNPNPGSGNPGHSKASGSNAAWLYKVSSQWTEFGVTWVNQPSVSNLNRIDIPESMSDSQNYTNIDVKTMVEEMVHDPSNNYGFMLQLQTESYYRSLLFASSDHPNPGLHPKLEISYIDTSETHCLTLQPGHGDCGDGMDAVIGDCIPCGNNDQNFGAADELGALAWTSNGFQSIERGLIQFDLSSIPNSAVVHSALLSLYWNPNPGSGNPGHSKESGSNAAWLQRINSPWTEFDVNWTNQPSVSPLNQISIPASTDDSQNYSDINVTQFIQDMVHEPSQNFGFMLRLQTELYYRSLLFASSDHPNSSLHPKLTICYSLVSKTNNLNKPDKMISIFPNPASHTFNITLNKQIQNGQLQIFNLMGQKVYEDRMEGQSKSIIASLKPGCYSVVVCTIDASWTNKLIIN